MYYGFIEELKSDKFDFGYSGIVSHTYSENYSFGRRGAVDVDGKEVGEKIDAIEIKNLDLTVKIKLLCEQILESAAARRI